MRRLTSAAVAAVLGLSAVTAIPPAPARAEVYVGVSVGYPPPPLPFYDQPPIPGPGYIWTPGYWAWGGGDYYWVPGTWVLAPEPGFLWTPAYWGWDDGAYLFHIGYWGPLVGFYGGIDYGFGYTGFGYVGGYWNHDRFFYNRSVNNITNVNITNVYNRRVTDNRATRVSYNGGAGGLNARPTHSQLAAARAVHLAPTSTQLQHQRAAAALPALHASANHGVPPIAATSRPAVFGGRGVVPAVRTASQGAWQGRTAALGAGGVSQHAMRGAVAPGAVRTNYDPRLNSRSGTQAHARVPGAGPASARAADRYGVPASAVTHSTPEARRVQTVHAPRAYSAPASREPMAPSRASQYVARRAPEPSFGGERRGAPAQAFRAPPHNAAPSGPPRGAPARPQGRESPRR